MRESLRSTSAVPHQNGWPCPRPVSKNSDGRSSFCLCDEIGQVLKATHRRNDDERLLSKGNDRGEIVQGIIRQVEIKRCRRRGCTIHEERMSIRRRPDDEVSCQ